MAPFFGRIHVCFFALLAKYCHSGFGMLAQVLLGPSFFKWCFQALLSDERVGIRLLNSKTDDRLTDKDAVRKLLMEETLHQLRCTKLCNHKGGFSISTGAASIMILYELSAQLQERFGPCMR